MRQLALLGTAYAFFAVITAVITFITAILGVAGDVIVRWATATALSGVALVLLGNILWYTDRFWAWRGLRESSEAAQRTRRILGPVTVAWGACALTTAILSSLDVALSNAVGANRVIATLFSSMTLLIAAWIAAVSQWGSSVLRRDPPDWYRA
jgi:hypothetical protein